MSLLAFLTLLMLVVEARMWYNYSIPTSKIISEGNVMPLQGATVGTKHYASDTEK